MELFQRCQREVEELYAWFQGWFAGQVPDPTAAWERLTASWAPGFQRITPEGELVQGQDALTALQVRYASPTGARPEAIWTEAFAGYALAEEGLFLATYQVWESDPAGAAEGRVCTAILREQPGAPNGLVWLHLHETPLAASVRPSFKPTPAGAAVEDASADADDEPQSGEPLGFDPATYRWEPEPDSEQVPELTPAAQALLARRDAGELSTAQLRVASFFGDAVAQEALAERPPDEWDARDPDRWVGELRELGPEGPLRAGLVVLRRLLEPWERWFPESSPRDALELLERAQQGEAGVLEQAWSLVERLDAAAGAARRETSRAGDEISPDDFARYVESINAADWAGAVVAMAGAPNAVAAGQVLNMYLGKLDARDRQDLRQEILREFSVSGAAS